MSLSLPTDFKTPPGFKTDEYKIRMLKVSDVEKDYEAIMNSLNHLQGVFGPNHNWPSPQLTLEQDLIDLGWHQKEFQKGSSFAYTVMNLDESICLGCVYIDPCDKERYDAEVYMWVRESEYNKGLDKTLFKDVKNWIEKEWPFKNIAYPGRELSWEEWKKDL